MDLEAKSKVDHTGLNSGSNDWLLEEAAGGKPFPHLLHLLRVTSIPGLTVSASIFKVSNTGSLWSYPWMGWSLIISKQARKYTCFQGLGGWDWVHPENWDETFLPNSLANHCYYISGSLGHVAFLGPRGWYTYIFVCWYSIYNTDS